MKETFHLDHLMEEGIFRFSDLKIAGIDNAPVLRINRPEMAQEETCLFHRDISGGDQYLQLLDRFVREGMSSGNPAPVVRFADGEYAFYARDLHCNGLYQQAESIEAIEKALPRHIEALRALGRSGKLAPLIHPGNSQRRRKKGLLSFIHRKKPNTSAVEFVEFLHDNQVSITGDNYVPFYAVYAYLSSVEFAHVADRRHLCIISSECDIRSCKLWFERFSSKPEIIFIQLPESYVATQWENIRKGVMDAIPSNIDICLIGAGIGSLPVCVDVAAAFSVPAIDAGHILNMMNGREDKSNGPRLYTVRGA
jgi:hypothetical protein